MFHHVTRRLNYLIGTNDTESSSSGKCNASSAYPIIEFVQETDSKRLFGAAGINVSPMAQ